MALTPLPIDAHLPRILESLRATGRLVLAAARPDKYEELAQAQICDNTVRALPALAEGLLYVRDTQVLKCIDLRPGRP